MNRLRVYHHLARADFLERVRRYSFLIILAVIMYLGYAINRGDFYLRLDDYRGVLNSAWIGGMMATSAIIVISLFGFYFVKNAVERDMDTGVGQIIATSPVSRPTYLFGKWLSNWLVLSTLVGILAGAAVVMQILAGEGRTLDLVTLLSPFLLLALPAMAVVGAFAILFESISWLHGGWGNVVYFFLWTGLLSVAFITGVWWLDWSGIIVVQRSMAVSLRGVDPTYSGTFDFTWKSLPAGGLHTFEWPGIQWTSSIVLQRIAWLVSAAMLAIAGSLFFHRFDPTRERKRRVRRSDKSSAVESPSAPGASLGLSHSHLGRLAVDGRAGSSTRALVAELLMVIKGQPWWWHAGVIAVIIGGAASPSSLARQAWLPAAWIWPMLLWSKLGTREEQYQTKEIVFSSPHPLSRQLPWTWMSGFIITAVVGSGVLMNLLSSADWGAIGAWLSGAIFIPSLALTLGIWSHSSKPFEIIYLLLWYLGPMHAREMPGLDFMGVSDAAIVAGMPMLYALMAVLLMGIALLGRWRQLRA